MKNFIEKIQEIEIQISKEIGPLNFFGIFERDDLREKYDIVVSLDLKEKSKKEIFSVIHNHMVSILAKSELLMFSRFVYLEPNHPFVKGFNQLFNVEHSKIDIKNSHMNGLEISHAIIITSKNSD